MAKYKQCMFCSLEYNQLERPYIEVVVAIPHKSARSHTAYATVTIDTVFIAITWILTKSPEFAIFNCTGLFRHSEPEFAIFNCTGLFRHSEPEFAIFNCTGLFRHSEPEFAIFNCTGLFRHSEPEFAIFNCTGLFRHSEPEFAIFNCTGLFRHSEGTWSRSISLHVYPPRSITMIVLHHAWLTQLWPLVKEPWQI